MFLDFLAYFGSAVVLLVVGTVLFETVTKIKEFQLIARGNKAAALALGGKVVGLALVLQSALAHSVSLLDMVIWGAIAIAVQIIVYFAIEFATQKFDIEKSIEEGNVAVGLMMFAISIALGLVNAGALTY